MAGRFPLLSDERLCLGLALAATAASASPNSRLRRMVVVGDSLLAGFASGGLVQRGPTGQRHGASALIARQAGVSLPQPYMSGPGHPPPQRIVDAAGDRALDANEVRWRVGIGFRSRPGREARNLAVPGEDIRSVAEDLDAAQVAEQVFTGNPDRRDIMKLLILGLPFDGEPVSQLRAARGRQPTRHVGADSTLMQHLAPGDSNRFLTALREHVEKTLTVQAETILREFSLDNSEGALARLVRELKDKHGEAADGLNKRIGEVVQEFSLDNEQAALRRLVRRVETTQKKISDEFSLDAENSALARMKRELTQMIKDQDTAAQAFQTQVVSALDAMRSRKAAEAASTIHGHDFQQAGFEVLQDLAEELHLLKVFALQHFQELQKK